MPQASKELMTHIANASTLAKCSKRAFRSQRHKPTSSPAFYRFKDLPQEIQDMIWQDAIDAIGPRVVNVRRGTYRKTHSGNHLRRRQITSPCPIPAVLHACRTSRSLALKRWELTFTEWEGDERPKIFFDFASDTLYFDQHFGSVAEFTDRVVAFDRERVRRIAFHLRQQGEVEYSDTGASLSLCDFPNLAHLILPVIDYDFDYDLDLKGWPQPERDPKEVAITFYEADSDDVNWESWELYTLDRLLERRKAMGGETPVVSCVNYLRSTPGLLEKKEHELFDMEYCYCQGPEEVHKRCPDGDSCRYCN